MRMICHWVVSARPSEEERHGRRDRNVIYPSGTRKKRVGSTWAAVGKGEGGVTPEGLNRLAQVLGKGGLALIFQRSG